jgi:hypothetical protein
LIPPSLLCFLVKSECTPEVSSLSLSSLAKANHHRGRERESSASQSLALVSSTAHSTQHIYFYLVLETIEMNEKKMNNG